jgi:hypothetical protein
MALRPLLSATGGETTIRQDAGLWLTAAKQFFYKEKKHA